MVKKNIGERICRDCGRPIIGRRIDAIICKDCRRKAQEEASQRIKKREKEERILKKVEKTGVKGEIEREKTEQILKNLKEALEKTKPSGVDVSTGVGTYSKEYPKKDKKDESKIKKFIEIAKQNEKQI